MREFKYRNISLKGAFAVALALALWIPVTAKTDSITGAITDQLQASEKDSPLSMTFGQSVSIDGSRMAVGQASLNNPGPINHEPPYEYLQNAVYIFENDGSQWTETHIVRPNDYDSTDYVGFGVAVSLAGSTLAVHSRQVVGYYPDGYPEVGSSVFVFELVNGSWTQQAEISQPFNPYCGDPFMFGLDLEVQGDTLAIGDPGVGRAVGCYQGAAYVYVRTGDAWSQQAVLSPADLPYQAFFGASIALDGNTLVVGVPSDDELGVKSGSAYVFVRDGTDWTLQAKLNASDGSAYDSFGLPVAIEGDRVLVSAHRDDDNGIDSGSVYVFERSGTAWAESAKLLPADGSADRYFGWTMAMDGRWAAISDRAPWYDSSVPPAIYVFGPRSGTWNQLARLPTPADARSDVYGWSLDIDAKTVAVGDIYFGDHNQGRVTVLQLGATAYACSGFEPPMADYPVTVKKSRALPLKAQVFDADGYAMTDAQFDAPPVLQVLFDSGAGGDPVDVTDDALPAGLGTEGNQFVFTAGGNWQFNLLTKNYSAPGTYIVTMETGDDTEYEIDPACVTEFVIQ